MNRKADTSTNGKIIDPYGRNMSFSNAEEHYTTTLMNQANNALGEDIRTNYGIIPYTAKSSTSYVPATGLIPRL